MMSGRLEESLELTHQGIAALDRAMADFPVERPLFLESQAHNYRYMGFRLEQLKNYPAAREAFAASTSFFRESRKDTKLLTAEAIGLEGEALNFQKIGDLWTAEGHPAEAREAYRQALAVQEIIEERELAPHIGRGWAAEPYIHLEQLLGKVGTPEDAMRIAAKLHPPDPKATAATVSALANCHFRLAEMLRKDGKVNEASAQLARAEELSQDG